MLIRMHSISLSLLILILFVQCASCTIFQQSQAVATVCECAGINELVESIIVVNSNSEAISISGNCENYFAISQIIGAFEIRIRVKGSDQLDFEAQNSYKCTILAVDSDGTECSMQLDIFLSDCNDNAPEFQRGVLSATLPETTSIGDVVFVVAASDEDSGINKELTFSIDDTSGKFQIGEITGKITLIGSLDFETQREYDFIVTVTDGGNPAASQCPGDPLMTTKAITILVSDSADTPPRFTDGCCQFSVAECAPVSTEVGTFSAYDGDLQVDDSIEFGFLLTTSSCFALALSGLLTVSSDNCLDRETAAVYTLNVEAVEAHQPFQSVRADFDIRILDCNDIAPEFYLLPSSFSFNEGIAGGSTLFTIRTSDGDEPNTNNSRTYISILPQGNTDDIFAINSHSSALTCTQMLDRESYPNGFQLVLEVTDYGNPPLSSNQSVSISLNDINDNPPTFHPSNYSVTIPENLSPNVHVLTLNATDRDIGTNAELVYRTVSGNDADLLSINQITGDIRTTNNIIDRETYVSLELIVAATDSGTNPLQATATVTILISDLNDNTPTFSPPNFNFSVEEEQNPGAISLAIAATDLDDISNGNGLVNYSIISGNRNIFFLNGSFLRTTLRFDRETMDEYMVVIEGKDNGIPTLSSTATVTITILDTNDNAPEFSREVYIIGFSENAEYETVIIQFLVTDRDLPPHNLVVFEFEVLIQGFSFDTQTGTLVTDKHFSGRAGESFDFTITAYDNEKIGAFNSASKPVKVIVIKETDRLIALIDRPLELVRNMAITYQDLLENITNGYVNIEEFVPVSMQNQIDSSQTQIIFHVIDLNTESVADPAIILKDVDERFDEIFVEFTAFSVKSISQYTHPVTFPYTLPALVSVVSILGALLILTCCCFCLLFWYMKYYRQHVKRKSERDLDEAGNLLTKQHAKSFSSLSAIGTSGIFARSDVAIMDNPLWIHPYENMGSLYSNDSTLYESKELIIDLFSEDLDEYSLYSVPSRVNTELLNSEHLDLMNSDSASSMDQDELGDLANSESDSPNFDFPSTSSGQKLDLDTISEGTESHLSII